MTLITEHQLVAGSPGSECDPDMYRDMDDNRHCWDVNDSTLPRNPEVDRYQEWPNGHCKFVYREDSEEARKHSSGWAMRNTNNHNNNILKKSCLGVLLCSKDCTLDNGNKIHLRPAICDKARKKQLGKSCPNPRCNGMLGLRACRGHCGYPVTHFWRHVNGLVFFQAKGTHDHDSPEVKSSAEARRHHLGTRIIKTERKLRGRKRQRDSTDTSYVPAKIIHIEPITDINTYQPKPAAPLACTCASYDCYCSPSQHIHSANTSPQHAFMTPAMEQKLEPTITPEQCDFTLSRHQVENYSEYFDFGSYNVNKKQSDNMEFGFDKYEHNVIGSSCRYSTEGDNTTLYSLNSVNTSPNSYSNMSSHADTTNLGYSDDSPSRQTSCAFDRSSDQIDPSHTGLSIHDLGFQEPDFAFLEMPMYGKESLPKDDKSSIDKSQINIDISSLLPSITSFLGEDGQPKESCSVETDTKTCQVVPTSPGAMSNGSSSQFSPVRGNSPLSLTELQPVTGSTMKPHGACPPELTLTSAVMTATDNEIRNSAFYPYTDILTPKDTFSPVPLSAFDLMSPGGKTFANLFDGFSPMTKNEVFQFPPINGALMSPLGRSQPSSVGLSSCFQ